MCCTTQFILAVEPVHQLVLKRSRQPRSPDKETPGVQYSFSRITYPPEHLTHYNHLPCSSYTYDIHKNHPNNQRSRFRSNWVGWIVVFFSSVHTLPQQANETGQKDTQPPQHTSDHYVHGTHEHKGDLGGNPIREPGCSGNKNRQTFWREKKSHNVFFEGVWRGEGGSQLVPLALPAWTASRCSCWSCTPWTDIAPPA